MPATVPATAAATVPPAVPATATEPPTEPSGQAIVPAVTEEASAPATAAAVTTALPTASPTETPTAGPPTIPPIEPLQTAPPTTSATAPATTAATETATTAATEAPPTQTEAPRGGDLATAKMLSDVVNPDGMLIVSDGETQSVGAQGIDLASLKIPDTNAGLSTMAGKNDSQDIRYCNANGECEDLSAGSAKGAHIDTPIGWLGDDAIYERTSGAGVSYRAVNADTGDDRELVKGGQSLAAGDTVIDLGNVLLVPGQGSWVRLTSDGGSVLGNNPWGSSLAQVRAYSSKLGFVAGGTLVITSLDDPTAVQAQVSANVVGYDISPDGSQVAISDGSTISVYGLDGSLRGSFANSGGIRIGSLVWRSDGIEFIDRTNGVIRVVDPAKLG
jgi:hypothetical protein